MHTACLSGDNGSGKSALIDAMTWALWGKSRAKSDDDLIHTGQQEMEVEFDFRIGEKIYRIIRKRSRPKWRGAAGQSSLDLFIDTDAGFRAISGDTIKQTEEKLIRDILHMDYETFINSAFLRQGNADRFTTKPPAERKEVLARILGLSLYDELEARARELAREREMEKNALESAIKEINEELARKPLYEAELEQAQRVLSQLEAIVKEQEARLNELRQQKESLERKKVEHDKLEEKIRATQSNLERWQAQAEQHRSRIREYEAVMAQRAAIEEGYQRFAEVKKLNDELNQKLVKLDKLKDRKNQLEKIIDSAQATLVKDHELAQRKIAELEAKAQRLPLLRDQLQQLQAELDQLAREEEELAQRKEASHKLQSQVSYLESAQEQLKQAVKELEEKIELLSARTEGKCPLCERELGSEGLKLIESKYTAEREDKAQSLASNQAELAQKKAELASLNEEIARQEARLNQEKITAQSKVRSLNQEKAEEEEAAKQLAEERAELAQIEQRLAKKDFATSEQVALAAVEAELSSLDYDPARHEQVRLELHELERYENPKRKLEEADKLIGQEREAAARAEAAVKDSQLILEADNQRREMLSAELGLLPKLLSELEAAETEHRALDLRRQQAQEALGQAKANLQRCAEREKRKQEIEALWAQAAKEEGIYKDLAGAFGKGGIQALLIEMALPEIREEANRLLGRMTDNRMHVSFETQRPQKTGDKMIETLDIIISDELGTRSYEMFSGGEAFRINFAIRIALSRLLARRSGAPLRTLIIDEGFGTQDSTGIEKLIEAINSIQEDFDLILVITHIEELRNAFAARIDVAKTSQGSTLSIQPAA
jgi:exonuclease SbcC